MPILSDPCKQIIEDIEYHGGYSTLTGTAMNHVFENEFTVEKGDRPEAKNIMIVVTDGKSKDKGEFNIREGFGENTLINFKLTNYNSLNLIIEQNDLKPAKIYHWLSFRLVKRVITMLKLEPKFAIRIL